MSKLVVYMPAYDNNNAVGTVQWANVAGVTAEAGGIFAEAQPTANQITQYAEAKGGDFSALPDAATLNSVKVEWLKHNQATSPTMYDNSVRVAPGGVISGDDKSAGNAWLSGGGVRFDSYGGPGDPSPLWSVFTVANLKDPLTTFLLSGKALGGSFGAVAKIEACRVIVDYT